MALKWSGLGMNVGGYGTISLSDVEKYYTDLDEIKRLGFTCVRIGSTDPTFATAFPLSKLMAVYAKSIGLHTTWGLTTTTELTNSNYETYEDFVLEAAQYAEDNNFDAFEVGNEIESLNDGTTLTDEQLIAKIVATAASCQAIFSGDITYASTAGSSIVDLWISEGITPGTDLDYLSFNVYGNGQDDLSGFSADAKRIWDGFGTDSIISEFNLVTDNGSLTLSQQRQEEELSKRLSLLRAIGFEQAYFFVWKKSESNEKLGLKYIGLEEYKQYYWSLIGGRRWFQQV